MSKWIDYRPTILSLHLFSDIFLRLFHLVFCLYLHEYKLYYSSIIQIMNNEYYHINLYYFIKYNILYDLEGLTHPLVAA